MDKVRGALKIMPVLAVLLFAAFPAAAGDGLCDDIKYLSSESCGGRRTATPGAQAAAEYIHGRLKEMGYRPWYHCFDVIDDGSVLQGRNVYAVLQKGGKLGDWVLICAYYDGMGTVDGKLYPGADCNASGTAALLALADSLKALRKNIIFAALDAHRVNRQGASILCANMRSGGSVLNTLLLGRNPALVLCLDTMGSNLAPVEKYRKNYVLMVGASQFAPRLLRLDTELSIYFDYYGSDRFTDVFFNQMSDAGIFKEAGMDAVMVTSGITDHTQQKSDTYRTINYKALMDRIEFLSLWINNL